MDEWLGGAVYSASGEACTAFAPGTLPAAPLPPAPLAGAATTAALFGAEEEGRMLGLCGDWGMAPPLLCPGGQSDDDGALTALLPQLRWGDEDMLPVLSAQEQQLLQQMMVSATCCSAQHAANATPQPAFMAGAIAGPTDACCTPQSGHSLQLLAASVPRIPPCSSVLSPTSDSCTQLPQQVSGTPLLAPASPAAAASGQSRPHSPVAIMEAARAAVCSWAQSGGAITAAAGLQPASAPGSSGGVSRVTLGLLAGLLSAAQPPALGALRQGEDGRLRGELLQIEMPPKGLLPGCRAMLALEVEVLEP